jgi:integrase
MLATLKNADLGGVTPPSNLEALRERGADLEAKRRSSATRKVYAREIAAFDAWTAAAGFPSDPGNPVAVYGYLAHLADRKALATIRKVAACLSSIAKERGHVSPLKNDRIAGLLSGLRRETAEKGIRQAERAALPLDDLRTMLATLDLTTLTGQRDAAILLLGFTGAMRRSEIVALDLEDLRFVPEGATIEIRLSKSDQTGEGATVAIPFGSTLATCPVRNLKAWIDASKGGESQTPEISVRSDSAPPRRHPGR